MLQPSLSLQIEFHTSNLFQMLLSVAACQLCLPLTQCLHKVFSPHCTGLAALFSDSIQSVCKVHLVEVCSISYVSTFCCFFVLWICPHLISRSDGSFHPPWHWWYPSPPNFCLSTLRRLLRLWFAALLHGISYAHENSWGSWVSLRREAQRLCLP